MFETPETVIHEAEKVATDAAAAAVPEVAQVEADAKTAEHVVEEAKTEAPAVERVVAGVSRNADGTIREVGARLVGERDELVAAFHKQLIAVAGHLHPAEELFHRAEAEVEAMLHGHKPPTEPIVPVKTGTAGGVVIEAPEAAK